MGKGALAGAGAATAAIGGIGAGLLSVAGTFDDAFDGMRVQTGLTGQAAEDLNQSFKNVFGNTPADAETVSAAMGTLVQRTGATGPALEELTTQVANLSRVTGIDATTAANAAADVFAKWGVSAEDQGAVMDELFAASQRSGVGFDKLSADVASNSAQLKAAGLDYDRSINLIAGLGKAGLSTSDVMPGLSKALGAAMKSGKEPGEALAATFAKIQAEGANSKTAMEVFGKSGVKMAEAISSGTLSLDSLKESLLEDSGAINKTAADTDDFGQKFDTFKNKLMVAIEPAATSLMDSLGVAMDKLAPLIPPVADALGRFFGFLADNPALAAVVGVIGVLGGAIAGIGVFLAPLIPIVGAVMGGFGALAGVLGTVGSVIGTIAALFNPVGIAIAAVVAIVAGLKLAWDNDLGGIQEKTAAVVAAVKQWFADMVAKVEEIVAAIAAKWEEFKANLQAAMDSAGNTITAKWTEFWTTITTKLQEIHDAVVQKWEEVKTAISEALELIWNTLKLKWDAFLREISDKLDAILGKVTDAWTAVKDKIQEAMDAVWNTIQSLWAQIKDNIETALGNIRQNVENIMGRVREIFETAMGIVKQVVSDVLSHITTLWGNFQKFVDGVVQAFKQLISGDFAGAFDTMKQVVSDGIHNVLVFFNDLGDSIMRAIGDAASLLINVGTDIVGGLIAGIQNAWDTLLSTIQGLVNNLPQWLRDLVGAHSPADMTKPIGAYLALGIGDGFARAWNSIVLPMINKVIGGGGITPPRLDPNEPGGWAGGLAPIGGWWEGKPPAQETRPVFPGQPPRWSMGGLPPGSRPRWEMGTPPQAGDMGNSWFGGTSRTRVKPMQTGKGGFVQASKSNFWHIWVQRNGIPEESSARKTADMLGIPLPQWLEDIYAPLAKENIKADGPLPGVATAAGTVAAALGGLAAAVGEVAAKFNELLPIVTNHGTVPGTGPGGGTIHLPGVGGGGQPLLPPGGKIEPPPIIGDSFNVNADSVVVPSMTAYVTSNVSVAIMISDKVVDTIATIVDKKLAQRASVGVP